MWQKIQWGKDVKMQTKPNDYHITIATAKQFPKDLHKGFIFPLIFHLSICEPYNSGKSTVIHILFSIYTVSDLGVLSNLIGSLSLANEHYYSTNCNTIQIWS